MSTELPVNTTRSKSLSSLIINTNDGLASSQPNEKARKTAIDAFNESIGETMFGDAVTGEEADQRLSMIDDLRNYRALMSRFILKQKLDESSVSLF